MKKRVPRIATLGLVLAVFACGGGAYLAFGAKTRADDSLAVSWWSYERPIASRCADGDGHSCRALAESWAQATPPDLPRATDAYRRAAVAYQLKCGEGPLPRCDNSKEDCNDSSASYCAGLGALYRDGHGVATDINRAAELFSRACDAQRWPEVRWGCFELSKLARTESLTPSAMARAAPAFQKFCDSLSSATSKMQNGCVLGARHPDLGQRD